MQKAALKVLFDIHEECPDIMQLECVREILFSELVSLESNKIFRMKNLFNYLMYSVDKNIIVINEEKILPYLTYSVARYAKFYEFIEKDFVDNNPTEDILLNDEIFHYKEDFIFKRIINQNLIDRYKVVPEEIRKSYKKQPGRWIMAFGAIYGQYIDIRSFIDKENIIKYNQYFWLLCLTKLSRHGIEDRISILKIYNKFQSLTIQDKYIINFLNSKVITENVHDVLEFKRIFPNYISYCQKKFNILMKFEMNIQKQNKLIFDSIKTETDKEIEKDLKFYLGDIYIQNKKYVLVENHYIITLDKISNLMYNSLLNKEKIIAVSIIVSFMTLFSSLL